ncbi:MAG TPA: hypothetical protein VGK59_19425, partial [Ohtaekwangia sp.]
MFLVLVSISPLTFAQTTHNVVWSDLIGCTVSGNTLTKNVADGWGNSAATGLHYLESNTDGFLEYTVDAINRKAFGLSDLNSTSYNGAIDYCFNIGIDSKAYVLTNGAELANTPIVIGDILKIERTGSTITFKKNGTTVHSISSGLTTALLVDVALNTNGASLVNMKTSFGPSPHAVLQWTSVKGMSVSGDNLLRINPFSAGYGDSGAASAASLPAGQSGYVEVVMSELDRRRVVGFASSGTYTNLSGVTFGLQFDNDNVHAYENGVQGSYLGKFTANSVVKLSREGNQIRYYINGVLRYTSPNTSTTALYVHVGFYNQLGTIKNVYASFGPGQGTVPDRVEYEALKAFYDSLGGAGWTNKTNWPTGTWPRHKYNTEFNNWFGITIQNGDVTVINAGGNNLTGFIPSKITQLKKLNYLRLWNNKITGKIPTDIGALTDLTYFAVSRNLMSGTIPASIGNLVNLTWLSLYLNNFTGSLPSSFYNLTKLTDLYIYDTQISGGLSEQFGNLNKLVNFWGYRNQWSGPLPSSLGNITTLQNLYLYSNNFSGTVPSNWQNLTNLRNLWLHYLPNLSGELPTWIGNFTLLQTLAFGDNDIHGSLPVSYGNLTNLTELYLFNLNIEGTVPVEWGNLNKLTLLSVFGNPGLTGSIPSALANRPTLKTIATANCSFTDFPDVSARTNKADMIVRLEGNKIPVASIERYFTGTNAHVFDSLFYGGQQLPEPDSVEEVMLNTELRIDAPHGGVHGVYLWEKLINGTWTNINHLNYSSSPQSFVRTTAAVDDAGSYRYTVTNSWMP